MADVRINGKVYDWGSVTLRIAGVRFGQDSGILEISWGQKRERQQVSGMGRTRAPAAHTGGRYSCNPVKYTCVTGTSHAIIEQIAQTAPDGKSYGDVDDFAMSLQLVENKLDTISYDWTGCAITEEEGSASEGEAGPLKEPLTIQPLRMTRNGMSLFSQQEG